MDHKVIVFSTPSCTYCVRAKDYLRGKKIAFRDVDVSRDESARKDMVSKTGQTGVPVILVDNKPIVGFDKMKLDRLLGIKA